MHQPTIPDLFEIAVNAPLQELPPLVHLMTHLPREYPLLPRDALQPKKPPTFNVTHAFYRNQRTYTTSTGFGRIPGSSARKAPPPNQHIPELEPILAFYSHMHSSTSTSVNKLDETTLFDRLASCCPDSTVQALINAWTTYFQHHYTKLPHYAPDVLPCALLFLLKLRYAKTMSLSQLQTHYSKYLCSIFQSLGATKCELTWDTNTESRYWAVCHTNGRHIIVTPHSRIPDTIRITVPKPFERPHQDLLTTILNPQKQDPFLEQCISLAHANGLTTY